MPAAESTGAQNDEQQGERKKSASFSCFTCFSGEPENNPASGPRKSVTFQEASETNQSASILLKKQNTSARLLALSMPENTSTASLSIGRVPGLKSMASMLTLRATAGPTGAAAPVVSVHASKNIRQRYPFNHIIHGYVTKLKTMIGEKGVSLSETNYWTEDQLLRIVEDSAGKSGFSVEAAFESVEDIIAFREEYKPSTLSAPEVEKDLSSGKLFFHKRSKVGRPCAIFKAGLHNMRGEQHGLLAAFSYGAEWLCNNVFQDGEVDSSDVIIDLKGVALMKCNGPGIATLMTCMQTSHPGRAGTIFIVNAPRALRFMWKMIKKVLNKGIQQRVMMVKNTKKTMLKYYDSDNLLPEYGGTSSYKFEWNGNIGQGLGISGNSQLKRRGSALKVTNEDSKDKKKKTKNK